MALLETLRSRVPGFSPPAGGTAERLSLSPAELEQYFARMPMLAGLLDSHYETRPGAQGPEKVSVRDALLEHVEIYRVPSETTIFAEGSFGEFLFILLQGRARCTTSFVLDAERSAHVPIEDLEAGAVFGEHSVLSMNAHLLTVRTTAEAVLLLVPQFIAQELTGAHENFRQAVMRDYVSRALQMLVRRVPMLRYATDEQYTALLGRADLRTYGVGEVIFEEGDDSEDIFVVHDGFVKLAKRDGGEQKVLSYLVEGDCFGESGVLGGRARQASALAMSQVELLVIPGAAFRHIVESNPAAVADAAALENIRQLESDMIENVTFIGNRLEFQAEVMPNLDVIVIDENLCIRCDNCVKACAAAHEDGFSRLIRKGVTFDEFLIPTACRFCQDPVCLLCKSGGIKRDKDGDIYFTESCIGCSGCAQRCPYGNITMVDTDEIGTPPVPTLLDLALRRSERRRDVALPEPSDQRPKLKRLPVKCDLDKGHAFPACVNNCPTNAIKRYRADELDHILAGRA